MKVLVTGGAGFIGSNFIRYLLQSDPAYSVINLDNLTYAGNLENLIDLVENPRYRFVRGNIADKSLVDSLAQETDAIIHFAAETHVDRSIVDPDVFIQTNFYGTYVLLEASKKYRHHRFIHISTDEVYGSRPEGFFIEADPLSPSSPYSASKASSDLLVASYHKTYCLPTVITRCSNNFGPYQFPEKLIPLMVTNAMEDKPLPVYGDGLHVRDWLYVEDHCRAIDRVFHKGRPGEVYNIGGQGDKNNLEVVHLILEILNKPKSLIQYVKDRPGHDRRYAIDPEKIQNELGWKPMYSFEKSLEETVHWYQEKREWWKRIKSGEYLQMYEKIYGVPL